MKLLTLEDLEKLDAAGVQAHFVGEYEADPKEVDRFEVLIAYESVGSWGCDSSSFFLLREKSTGVLYEVHGSHCSCYGFEGQFTPERTSVDYLKSDQFHFCTGGYDNCGALNKDAVKKWIAENL